MGRHARCKRARVLAGGLGLVLLSSTLLAACTSQPQAVADAPAAPALGLLNVEPVSGHVGDPFTISAEGLPAGREVEFQWVTREGTFVTEPVLNDVRFHERAFVEKRVVLGRANVDSQGRVTAPYVAPEDFGENHDIYALVDGEDVARGGFRILRQATIYPTEGPIGTPITIVVTGIGWKPFENTMAVRYDNKYTGFLSAVTTKGSAVAQIRAAGPVGERIIQVNGASSAMPYLNAQQSGVAHIPMSFEFTFNVTEDAGPPTQMVEWPDPSRVASPSNGVTAAAPGVSATLEPGAGPTMSNVMLRAAGLPAGANLDLTWITGRGSDSGSGVRYLAELPLGQAAAGADGAVSAGFQVTDDRGGWQMVKVAQGEQVLAEVPFYVERSLVGITPQRVRAGETFTIQFKGGGWTELDKGIAVTYDNAYIGYACSVSSSGDTTLHLVATGGPGTHLIDVYPMIYRQKGENTPEFWNFHLPHLTALQDHPGLDLGYNLPIFRLAIEVVE